MSDSLWQQIMQQVRQHSAPEVIEQSLDDRDCESLKLPSISQSAMSVLEPYTELVWDLNQARQKPPFPPAYVPKSVTILYEDMPFIRWEDGQFTLIRNCPNAYHPRFTEIQFDDQTALFLVSGEAIVNRIGAMATFAEQLEQAVVQG
ncbi:hypothetical protein ACQ4M3_01385 [Leptolyngbya sp. AN03gr2]|uniref:hypothetical protein n=1 Tax=unclassified Leptolyngbya TaxID=2650499 RepID=UPI003D316A4D